MDTEEEKNIVDKEFTETKNVKKVCDSCGDLFASPNESEIRWYSCSWCNRKRGMLNIKFKNGFSLFILSCLILFSFFFFFTNYFWEKISFSLLIIISITISVILSFIPLLIYYLVKIQNVKEWRSKYKSWEWSRE